MTVLMFNAISGVYQHRIIDILGGKLKTGESVFVPNSSIGFYDCS
jgi:hypothetical protein